MNINVIGTGSTGNAILFCDSVLLDAGVPYKHIVEFSQQIKIVLLTHIHADHFNRGAIRNIYIENENIKFCCGGFLLNELVNMGLDKKRIITVEAGKKYKVDDVTFSPINLPHDSPNYGYRIMHNGGKHIHATDVANMDGITATDYDSATIEANHDLEEALKIIASKKLSGEFCHLERAIKTHLSVDKAIKFIADNNIKKWIPVHVGTATGDHVFNKIDSINNNQN